MSENESSPLFNIFSDKDVGGLIVRKLQGKDLSMFHERKWFDRCIPLMRLEMAVFFKTVKNPSAVPDKKIPLMYKIYYGSRRNLRAGIILISLQVPDPFFTKYFIDYLESQITPSRHDVYDNMWELNTFEIANSKVVKKAAEQNKLEWLSLTNIDNTKIHDVLFGLAKGGHIDKLNSIFNEKNPILNQKNHDNVNLENYLSSIMEGAAAGGHFDILGKYYLKYLEEFKKESPYLVQIVLNAAKGGHKEIFNKYFEKCTENEKMIVNEELPYYTARGNNIHFKDIAHKDNSITGFIRGGHIDHLPSPLVYKYTQFHFNNAVKYGRVNILRKIWNDEFALLLFDEWIEYYEGVWVEVREFADEMRNKQQLIRKELEKKYGNDFVDFIEIGWSQIQKDMDLANGNINAALLIALKRNDLDHVAF
jgi:hypothetical protein